jgi:peptide chain release factor subunit 1
MPTPGLSDYLTKLARIEPTSLPLLSCYLNTDVDGAGHHNYRTFLRKELAERVKTFAEKSSERAGFERDVERIEGYVSRELEPSAKGLALFACGGIDLFEAIKLTVPFDRPSVVVSDRPHLYPLARLADQYPRYAALLVNTNTARIFVFNVGATERATEVQNPKTKQLKVGGLSQARFQRHVENQHLQHVKEVVERLDEIVAKDQIKHVVVAGDEVIAPLLKDQVPERLADKLVNVLHLDIRTPEREVLTTTLNALRRQDEETDEAVVQDLIGDYRGGGPALVGAERTLAALRQGQVDTLVITATPEDLKGTDEVANELVRLAQRTSASVRFIENPALLADVGGVGASLRYVS